MSVAGVAEVDLLLLLLGLLLQQLHLLVGRAGPLMGRRLRALHRVPRRAIVGAAALGGLPAAGLHRRRAAVVAAPRPVVIVRVPMELRGRRSLLLLLIVLLSLRLLLLRHL